MKYNLLFAIILSIVLSCSEEETSKPGCQLTQIVVTGPGFVTQTDYTYLPSGRMDRQLRTRNGGTVFDYRYQYNSDGNVEQVDMGDRYQAFQYSMDGKVERTITNLTSGETVEEAIHVWNGGALYISYVLSSAVNPYQSTTLEFADENIVKKTIRSFDATNSYELSSIVEELYEDYDTSESPFYIASPTRPGYTPEYSKNNYGRMIQTVTFYEGEIIKQTSTSTTTYSYTYNEANAAVSSTSARQGATVDNTEITYDLCN